jgi:hypothetical protein
MADFRVARMTVIIRFDDHINLFFNNNGYQSTLFKESIKVFDFIIYPSQIIPSYFPSK